MRRLQREHILGDSARYSMLGNSIVVNVLAHIMQNVAERLEGTPMIAKLRNRKSGRGNISAVRPNTGSVPFSEGQRNFKQLKKEELK
jgi:hypothetical protein